MESLENDHDSSLSLKPSSNLELLVNQFNNATTEHGNDHEQIASSKYYDIDEIHNKTTSLINAYKYSIQTHVFLIKILMTFNIS